MKTFFILASLVALSMAEPPVSSYQAPSSSYSAPSGSSYLAPSVPQYSAPQQQSYGAPSAEYGAPSGGQVFRHVYVHSSPDEPVYAENKVIRVPGGGDKHVNIIFVKAPSSSSQSNTEVILPEQDQQKTVVYVLVKKAMATSDVQIRRPAAPAPSKPDVYFIRYKGAQQDSGYGVPQAPVVSGGY